MPVTPIVFPGGIDSFTEHIDLSPSEAEKAEEWKQLNASVRPPGSAADIRYQQLTLELSEKIFGAEDLNKLQACIVALEQYFLQEFFNYKGNYSSSTTYSPGNLVNYQGSIYSARIQTVGVAPTPGQTSTRWLLVSMKGDDGTPGVSGTGLSWRGEYDALTAYFADDCVAYDNSIWAAKSSVTGVTPEAGAYWDLVMTAGGGGGLGVTLPLSVANGGTGATTAAAARANLGVSAPTRVTVGWPNSYTTMTIPLAGVKPTEQQIIFVSVRVGATAAQNAAFAKAKIRATVQTTDLLELTCDGTTPVITIPLDLTLVDLAV
jgi:chitodextrinase